MHSSRRTLPKGRGGFLTQYAHPTTIPGLNGHTSTTTQTNLPARGNSKCHCNTRSLGTQTDPSHWNGGIIFTTIQPRRYQELADHIPPAPSSFWTTHRKQIANTNTHRELSGCTSAIQLNYQAAKLAENTDFPLLKALLEVYQHVLTRFVRDPEEVKQISQATYEFWLTICEYW